jgi:hypothetical protein
MKEKALSLGRSKSIMAILTEPEYGMQNEIYPAIIFLNAGLTHRVGPNRLYVKLARKIATQGIKSLRFDFSGIGDSPPRTDKIPFEQYAVQETIEVMNYLEDYMNIKQFIVAGMCSGADVGFQATCRDHRIIGLIGINGTFIVEGDINQMKEYAENRIRRRYYRKHLFSRASWYRLLSGQSHYLNICKSIVKKVWFSRMRQRNTKPKGNYLRYYRSIINRGASILLIYSEGSLAFDIFQLNIQSYVNVLSRSGRFHVEIFPNVDHSFTPIWSQELLISTVSHWLSAIQE